jgi:hypothetical protein
VLCDVLMSEPFEAQGKLKLRPPKKQEHSQEWLRHNVKPKMPVFPTASVGPHKPGLARRYNVVLLG